MLLIKLRIFGTRLQYILVVRFAVSRRFADDLFGVALFAELRLCKVLCVSSEHNIGSASRHIGGYRNRTEFARLGDYLGFALEKERLSEKLRATEKTFLLEAYVPAESEASVAEAISSATRPPIETAIASSIS